MSKLIGGREFNKNEKILLGIVMGLSIFFLYYVVFLGPGLNKLSPLVDEVKTLRKSAESAKNVQASIAVKSRELEEIKLEYDEATKAVPRGDRYPELIKELRESAKSQNVKIVSEVLTEPTTYNYGGSSEEEVDANSKEGLLSYTVNLSLEGDFNNILNFVDKLESFERVMSIESINSSGDRADIELTYIVSGSDEIEEYDFNNNTYGKDNLFR